MSRTIEMAQRNQNVRNNFVIKIRKILHPNRSIRADGRSLLDYRSIALETGVASLANKLGLSPSSTWLRSRLGCVYAPADALHTTGVHFGVLVPY